MFKIMKAGCLTLVFCALAALPAQAQMTWTDQGFVNVNFGVQAGSHDLATDSPFELYGETGSLTTTQDVGGAALFDLSAGYKVWRNLTLGIAYSRMKSDSDVAIAASVPHPDFFDRPRATTGIEPGADHSENQIHLQGTWMVPVTDKVDVGVSFGPSIFQVSQDIPTAITVTEPSATLASTSVTKVDKTTVGSHFGVDVNYMITPRWGAGVLARYAWGSADLEEATDSLTVGGFQFGGGLRVRF